MDNNEFQIKPLITRTPEQKAILRAYALENDLPELIYEDLKIYAKYMVDKIQMGRTSYEYEWFHYYICEKWNEIIFATGNILTIEVGPQIGKSLFTSLAISYIFGLNPNIRIVYVTYNEKKAISFTKGYVFTFMGSKKYKKIFPYVYLKNELDQKDSTKEGKMQRKSASMTDIYFTLSNPIDTTNYLGEYRAFGLDQGIHGIPADIFIIDDYVDNADSVRSENFKAKRREWFFNDMPSRLQDNSSVIVGICTRWYFDDIIGLLHNTYYDYIIPECKENDITPPSINKVKIRREFRLSDDNPPCDPRTKEGELLWKAHVLKGAVAKQGMYYDALYNCDPIALDGKRGVSESNFYYYLPEELPKVYHLDIVMDCASTSQAESDYTVIGVWQRDGRNRYLIDLIMEKWALPQLLTEVIALTEKYADYTHLLIEHASNGIGLCQYLREFGIRHTPIGFNSKSIGAKMTPMDKAKISTAMRGKLGRFERSWHVIVADDKPIRLPQNKLKHQDEFLRQIITFNGEKGRKDDCVDMLSHYINYIESNVIKYSNHNNFIDVNTLQNTMDTIEFQGFNF